MNCRKTYLIFILLFPVCAFSQTKRGANPTVQNPPPEVHFSWDRTCVGDTTCFFNETLLANTYTWTIKTGGSLPHTIYTSNDTNICFYFPQPGSYLVSLHAYNNHDVTVTLPITIDSLTKADFSWVHCSNQFVNNSLCSSSFYWDFGDGNSSTAVTPVHVYADTGVYNVKLIAYNGTKSDTMAKKVHVNVIGYSSAAFTYTVSYNTLFVHANYTDGQTNYFWSFNDPVNPAKNFATGRDTLHVYKDSLALYQVNLTTRNPCGLVFNLDTIRLTHLAADTNRLPLNLTFSSNLAIVPNPSSGGTLNVFYNSFNDGDYLVHIYNTLGDIIFERYFAFKSGINGFKISLDDLAQGAYVIILQSENTYARKKFVVLKQ
ncbi:MAG TPA: PKD domain-containing protein [Bacteroidia bacterium]|jgi:PKD repeat protein|nr:PKD domain-containing protein [Bacteroidia bacterium]